MELNADVVGAGSDLLHRVDGVPGVRFVTGHVLDADDRTGVPLVAIGGGNQPDGGLHLDLEVVGVGTGLEAPADRVSRAG